MKKALDSIVYVAVVVFWFSSGYLFDRFLRLFGTSIQRFDPDWGCALWFPFMVAGCALILSIRKLWAEKPNRDQ